VDRNLYKCDITWDSSLPNRHAARTTQKRVRDFFVVLLFAAPISSLTALFFIGGESWLRLYLKRKALEEKQKIEKLRGQENRDRPKP
jgi:hypothetical protein